MMIEYKKHYRHWKAIQEAFPSLSLEEIKSHANAFFSRINVIRPQRISMLDFIRRNSIEFFKAITFDKPSPKPSNDLKKPPQDKELRGSIQKNQSVNGFEEDKHSPTDRQIGGCRQSIEEMKAKTEPGTRYIPTQSQVMTDALKGSTAEMMKLIKSLVEDLQKHGEEIQKVPSAAGYWGYLYNSAVYLQQIINDVTVAHNSTLTFVQQENNFGFIQYDNIT
eukprot:TRINITY_DN1868_c0_g1_i3.p1 TRINITY_DN1868_c0_g1~~TRINITY_DN1868_c0_g1_i3.p1  ORF type:complete len:221 (+),score=58.82 TRINITY_DN1868_c0_g1_i3:725-1387(+)